MKSKRVLLLGASGSIGSQTLDIIRENKDKFDLVGFSVGKKVELIPDLLKEFKNVKAVFLLCKKCASTLSKQYPHIKFYAGEKGLVKLTSTLSYDMCVDALVGFVGLEPAITALKKNKILCLANKEALVVGGTIINELLSKGKGKLYPIDSEHVALAKCLSRCKIEDVKKLIITASGGALRDKPLDELKNMKAKDALNHPTWKMGKKITIDCATLMNKGFEVIEAYYLYHFPLEKIDVLMHDESLIHSAVELKDGTILLDYGKPDMHNPIRWALFEGDTPYQVLKVKSFKKLKDCHFREYDPNRYPCLEIAKKALQDGASKMIAMNAANEVLVNKFLNDEIKFLSIAKGVEKELKKVEINKNPSLKEIIALDKKVREEVR